MSEFELDKSGTRLTMEEHSDGEFYLGCEEPIKYGVNDDGTGHGCVSGMWLTHAEAVELRDWLSAELARATPDVTTRALKKEKKNPSFELGRLDEESP